VRRSHDEVEDLNFLLLTYDSCRYDVLVDAETPVLDSYCSIQPAQAPACFTYASHQAFFVGILPLTTADDAYYNRFTKQLLGLREVGEGRVVKESHTQVVSEWNLVAGLRDAGFQTVGAGAMNWFRQRSLTTGFDQFRFTGRDADAQVEFVRDALDVSGRFFGFVNFGETHAPFTFRGQPEPCPVDVRARRMRWPPRQEGEPTGRDCAAYDYQRAAAEFLDSRLPALFDGLPGNTVVILTADHGECFGEDGYWGHGVNHLKVFEVPLSIFRLDREAI
jgi:hypothetical protein